ncbi:hypothetical protein HMPREF3192_01325 [Atopobium deltae]|uniref:Uncharacterized protein n=1 Tax=Atopobium deltae TaxID=1393034 RepID=A0A133XPV7_9ACTN|nr:hypothetical protein HMPREF3192_01325 [Atopobium deltae]
MSTGCFLTYEYVFLPFIGLLEGLKAQEQDSIRKFLGPKAQQTYDSLAY